MRRAAEEQWTLPDSSLNQRENDIKWESLTGRDAREGELRNWCLV